MFAFDLKLRITGPVLMWEDRLFQSPEATAEKARLGTFFRREETTERSFWEDDLNELKGNWGIKISITYFGSDRQRALKTVTSFLYSLVSHIHLHSIECVFVFYA